MVPDGNSQNIIYSQDMTGFCDFGPVQANMSFLDECGGYGTMFDDPGKPKPLVQPLRQFFLPIIWALRAPSTANGELGSKGFSGRRLGSSRRSFRSFG